MIEIVSLLGLLCLYVCGFVLLFGVIAPYLPQRAWWIRIWVYGRQQTILLLGFICLLHVLVWGVSTLFAACFLTAAMLGMVWCFAEIFPYFSMGRKELDSADGTGDCVFSVLLLNVLEENDQYQRALTRIREADADMVLLCETNQAWADALRPLEDVYPHTYLLPLEDHNGLLFYSRFPMDQVDLHYLCQPHIPSLFIDLHVGENCPLRLYAIHPRPPRPEDDVEDLDDELIIIGRDACHHDCPVLVMGDLNEVGWSPAIRRFEKTSGLRDPKRGRGIFNTYGATNPILRWPLDHVFASQAFSVVDIERLPECGSDHFPIKYTLELTGTPA